MASSHQSFLTNHLSPIFQHRKKVNPLVIVSCRSHMDKDQDQSDKKEMPVVKFAVVTLAAGVLALGSVDGAMAAKTGGRVGGQAFRSSAPRPSSPRINNSRTNIYINPPVAPPLIGGYGYGGPFFGGYGWSPFSFFAPGPSVAVGIGGGFEIFAWFLVLGVVATIIRSFRGPRDDEDDY